MIRLRPDEHRPPQVQDSNDVDALEQRSLDRLGLLVFAVLVIACALLRPVRPVTRGSGR